MYERTRVLIVDDHRAVAEGLAAVLAQYDDLTVVGVAHNADTALTLSRARTVDVALLDIDLPFTSGFELAAQLKTAHPSITRLMWSMYANPEFVLRAIGSDARGYVIKEESAHTIAAAIQRVAAGERFFSESIRQIALAMDCELQLDDDSGTEQSLSDRQRLVLKLIAGGASLNDTATQLGIGVQTVRTLWARALKKLRLRPLSPGSYTTLPR